MQNSFWISLWISLHFYNCFLYVSKKKNRYPKQILSMNVSIKKIDLTIAGSKINLHRELVTIRIISR